MDPYIRALIENDGLEEVLADELEWTASQRGTDGFRR